MNESKIFELVNKLSIIDIKKISIIDETIQEIIKYMFEMENENKQLKIDLITSEKHKLEITIKLLEITEMYNQLIK